MYKKNWEPAYILLCNHSKDDAVHSQFAPAGYRLTKQSTNRQITLPNYPLRMNGRFSLYLAFVIRVHQVQSIQADFS